MSIQLDSTTYRKDVKYPKRLPSGFYHGYGGVRANMPPTRRLDAIESILIHTTNSPSGNTNYRPEALFLCDSPNVSTHYVASSHNTAVVQLLPDEYIAWHAGDCADGDYENPSSIGIEIAWVPGRGPLPQIAITNVTELVQMLLSHYPQIRKLDMHRAQAVPKHRKVDPSGWESADFYRWRDQMLTHAAPDVWAQWGTAFPLPPEQRTWATPQLWKDNAPWLGEARSFEQYSPDGQRSIQWFVGGAIIFEKLAGRAYLYHAVQVVP